MDFSGVERAVGYAFKDKQILQKALTLSSYDGHFNNQSMECLGDSVLGYIVAEKYYLEGMDEGDITQMKRALVSDKALAPVSKRLGLDRSLIRGKGDNCNKKAIPSAYEAMVAAIYLDGGMEEAKKFVLSTLDFSEKDAEFDYISGLQELLQADGKTPPDYLKKECGSPRQPMFEVTVKVGGKTFKGKGESFAEGKRIAAKAAYGYIKNKN